MESSSGAKLAALKQELRALKYPLNEIKDDQILYGDCRGFLPIFRALVYAYWPSVGSRFVDTYKEHDVLGLFGEVQASDPRVSMALVLGDLERTDAIVHNLYKFAREVLRMDIRLKESQFVSQGFQRSKIDFMLEFARSIKRFHQRESKQAKRGHRANALPRVDSAPEQNSSRERALDKHFEPQDTIAEAHPRPIPAYVQARCQQSFSCRESDQSAPAGDSAEYTAVWFPSDASFKGRNEHASMERHRVISEDFSYLHDVYGNLETDWLAAMPLTLDDSETTWLTNPDECSFTKSIPSEDRDYGLPLVNPLYSDTSRKSRKHDKSLYSQHVAAQNDQDLNSLLSSLEIHMDQASDILLH